MFEQARPDTPPGEAVIAGGGTFSANPMSATAGLATLDVIESEPVHDRTERRAHRLRQGLQACYDACGIDATVLGASSLFLSHFHPAGPLETVEDVETNTDRPGLIAFHEQLRRHGIYLLPGHMGSISYQTTTDHVDAFVDAARIVADDLQSEGVL